MVVLSDRDIKKYMEEGKLVIKDLPVEHIAPCSVDLRLGNKFRFFKNSELTHVEKVERYYKSTRRVVSTMQKRDEETRVLLEKIDDSLEGIPSLL